MSPRISFLLSAPYSGATLLSILANQHPRISSDGEIFPYDARATNLRCSCGEYQINCDYYRHAAKSMLANNGKSFDGRYFYYVPQYSNFHYLSRAFEGFWLNHFAHGIRNLMLARISVFRKIDSAFVNTQLDFFENSLASRKAAVYFDGSKSMRRAEFFAERKLAGSFVHLIRDGRAFCSSFLKNKMLPKDSMTLGADFWKKSIHKVEILKKRFPGIKMHTLRYNELCSDPCTELARFFDFLGLDYKDAYLEYQKSDMHILGNRMRFTYDGVIKEDNAWKNYFSKADLATLNHLIGRELESYGFI